MSSSAQNALQNKLLSLLPPADFDELASDLHHILLPRGTSLAEVGLPIRHIYFMTSGIGSVVASTPEGHRAEAGLFDFDGYASTSAASGIELSPHDVFVQVEGDGYRMDYSAYRGWMDRDRALSRIVFRSMEAFAVQLAYTALSNAVHETDERLARWQLMCHDRVFGNEVHLTHEYLSIMLGVRRSSVTTALHVLEGNGFIKATRGNITIRNRAAMEEFAHDAYGGPEEEYRRMMKDLF